MGAIHLIVEYQRLECKIAKVAWVVSAHPIWIGRRIYSQRHVLHHTHRQQRHPHCRGHRAEQHRRVQNIASPSPYQKHVKVPVGGRVSLPQVQVHTDLCVLGQSSFFPEPRKASTLQLAGLSSTAVGDYQQEKIVESSPLPYILPSTSIRTG